MPDARLPTLVFPGLFAVLAAMPVLPLSAAEPFEKWEQQVAAIEARNRDAGRGGVVFNGSSSIRLWDLEASFPGERFVNTGFGGSTIAGCTHFSHRLVTIHRPRAVVFYAGDNDIAAGRTPGQVREDFAAFVAAVHGDVPDCRVFFLSVKPSIARWHLRETQAEANALVREFCGRDDRLAYVDIVAAMLGTDGKPKAELFLQDGLHLSPQGYAIWTAAVATALRR